MIRRSDDRGTCHIERSRDVGVPLAKPRVALSAPSPRSCLAVGFPLQSLTRNAALLFCSLILSSQRISAQELDLRTYDYVMIDSAAIALQVPPHTTSAELAALLTKGLDKEHERFRAIFVWVAHNIEYKWGSYGSDPDKILKRKKAVCEGYASLLTSLCTAAGIECRTIHGYAKSFPDLHAELDLSKPNHAWNAVNLQGKWYVTDVTWAAGGYDMKKRKFFREFNEVYFLPLPENFIWNHFPADPEWKLCDVKLTKKQFNKLPVFYYSSLRLGVVPISGVQAKLGNKLDIVLASAFPITKATLLYGTGTDFITVNVEPTERGYRLTCKIPKGTRGVFDLDCDGFRLLGMLRP
jgi:hypothetical protein